MRSRVKNIIKFLSFALIYSLMTGCKEPECNFSSITGSLPYMRFTECDITDKPEEIYCSADSQVITLRIVSMTKPDIPYPEHIGFAFAEWDEDLNDWSGTSTPYNVNQPDDFYHVWSEYENGRPVVKVSVTKNDTGKTRRILVHVKSDKMHYSTLIFGEFVLYQEPESVESQTFSLKAKYKGKCIPPIE